MRHSLVRVVLGLAVAAGSVAVEPVAPTDAAAPTGAITWTVDHANKTIYVLVRLQIWAGCGVDPHDVNPTPCRSEVSASMVNQFLADKIKAEILKVWNKGHRYRCYKLIFDVDIKLGTDRFHIDDDRIGVRIDPSPNPIRSWVMASAGEWKSNDPADKGVPSNKWSDPTTWSLTPSWPTTYAHEFGHLLGLDDAYDHATGVEFPDAPDDLMSTMKHHIAQETINRLVERNRNELVDRNGKKVELSELRCEELVFESEIKGPVIPMPFKSEVHSKAEASVRLQGDESKGTLTGKAPLKYVTVTRRAVIFPGGSCRLSMNGKGETTFEVAQGSITRDKAGTPIAVELVIRTGETAEKLDAPCHSTRDPELKRFLEDAFHARVVPHINLGGGRSYWSTNFDLGHSQEFDRKRGGLPIRGWTIVNKDGVIATKKLQSKCLGFCREEITTLTLKEVK